LEVLARDDEMVPFEGPPLKNNREMLLYYGTTLLHLEAKGNLTQFEPPPRLEQQRQLQGVYPDLIPRMQQDGSFGALIGWSVEWARSGFPR
jgi:hypothetical protein